MKFLILLPILFTRALTQQNMIWIPTPYPECNDCLDQTFLGCPGNYQELSYAQCMCKGDGGVNLNTCVGICDSVDALGVGLGLQKVQGWYGYCTIHFQDMCADAQQYLDQDQLDRNCGPGSQDSTDTSGSSTGTSGDSGADTSASSSAEEDVPTATGGSSLESSSPDDGAAETPTPFATGANSGPSGTVKSATTPLSEATVTRGTGAIKPTNTNAAVLGSNPLPIWGLAVGVGAYWAY